ncbi:MAG: hypothetical protein ACLQQ4_12540 [Bacteroidia bacterium]
MPLNTRNSIARSLSGLILIMILHMHLCSAYCGLNGVTCCNDNDNDGDGCHDCSCCKHDKKTDKNCQTVHFSFFNTVGQYHLANGNVVPKLPSAIVSVLYTAINTQGFTPRTNFIPFNSHSPPPKEDIRVFIKSFLV